MASSNKDIEVFIGKLVTSIRKYNIVIGVISSDHWSVFSKIDTSIMPFSVVRFYIYTNEKEEQIATGFETLACFRNIDEAKTYYCHAVKYIN